MSEPIWAGVRRLSTFTACATFGVVFGLSSMTFLSTIINPETLPKSVGQQLPVVAVVLMGISTAVGVFATLGLRYAIDRLLFPVGSATVSADDLNSYRWRKAVAVYGLVCGSVLLVALSPVLLSQIERLGWLVMGILVGAVGIAAAKPRTHPANPASITESAGDTVTGEA